MRNQKRPDIQSRLELTEQIRIITLPDFKVCSEIIAIKALWCWPKTDTWNTETEIIIDAFMTNWPISYLSNTYNVKKEQGF